MSLAAGPCEPAVLHKRLLSEELGSIRVVAMDFKQLFASTDNHLAAQVLCSR